METRACTVCKEVKEAGFFTRRKTHRQGKLVSVCTPCKVNYNKARREHTPEKVAEIERRSKFKKQYGISLEQYAEMLENQGGGCAICGATKPSERTKYFAVDHCHSTGKVRGLLCSKCNRGLGLFNDKPERLKAAAKYLIGG